MLLCRRMGVGCGQTVERHTRTGIKPVIHVALEISEKQNPISGLHDALDVFTFDFADDEDTDFSKQTPPAHHTAGADAVSFR